MIFALQFTETNVSFAANPARPRGNRWVMERNAVKRGDSR
jgi:hypothetical protein